MDEPTLRTLLHRQDLRLRLVPAENALREGSLDHPLRWVHSSDLADPTPFLADDLLLLTTGTQLTDDDPAGTTDYVRRLVDRGVAALGFGTEVHRDGIPDHLVSACADRGLPLFEVPYDTPFIAVARAQAEAIAAQAYARRTWALEAQRALAVAALRPHGLESTLSELSRQLGHWVGLFDATGALTHEYPRGDVTAHDAAELAGRAAALLTRGGQAGDSLHIGERAFSLFTLGHSRRLRGIIAVAAAGLDSEARSVITSAVAMAGLALEQNERIARARRRLDAQVLASLQGDDPALARRVLGTIPAAPVMVAISDTSSAALHEWWDRRREEDAPRLFVAEDGDGVAVCFTAAGARPEAGPALVDELAERFDLRFGISDPVGYDAFSRAHAQARAALRRPGMARVVHYAEAKPSRILTASSPEEAVLAAERLLAPLRTGDAASAGSDARAAEARGALERSLRVWFEQDCRIEQAAAELGVHRHTLRTRIAAAAALLDMDLSSFPARAELWSALLLTAPS